jgi:L-iditol 2-dehydrogenase
MRAAVLNRPGDVKVVERPDPVPGSHEVVVRVTAVGVCGSDTHYFDHGRIGRFVVEQPMVLGHESSGVIEAVGSEVDPGRVGQRVSIEPGVPDFTCQQCLAGRYNLCPAMVFYATPPVDGSLAELAVIHETFAHPVPDSMSDETAALLEPLSVGVWACRKGGVSAGSSVLVTGAGPVGLVAAQVAGACGAAMVAVADINPYRLSVASRLGATLAIDVRDAELGKAFAESMRPDILIECSGHPGITGDGIRALAPNGTAVLVGMGGDELALPLSVVQERELSVTGTFRYANTWPTAIALVTSGRVTLDVLVTGHFSLDQTAQALTAARDDPHAIKAIILPQT